MIKKFFKYRHNLLCIFFTLLMLSHSHLFGNRPIKEILNIMSKSEKESLEKLFYTLFNGEHFIYTLFGDKPMSFTDYSTKLFDVDDVLSHHELRFQNRWKVWKKYKYLFPMKHYLLIESLPNSKGDVNIYFINRQCFIDKVDEHLELFQNALGAHITGALLLEKIEENPQLLSFISNHQILLGILLGYGKHNAQLFDQRNKLSPFVYRKEFPKIPTKIPHPSKGFSSLKDEFNSYFSVLTLFGDPHYSPLLIQSIHFVADHTHPETMALQQKYRKMRSEISAIYAKGNFLETTLSKLTED